MHIKKVWVIENTSDLISKATNRMIPDGCLEIILVEGEGVNFSINDVLFTCKSGVYLGGQLTKTIEIELLPQTRLYFFKINPWISPLLTSFPLHESTDRIIPFREINSYLTEKLHPDQSNFSIERSIVIFNEEVEKQKTGKPLMETHLMLKSCTRLVNQTLDFTEAKKELLSELKISSRTLEHRFNQNIGLSPKRFANTMRLRRVVEKLIYDTVDSSLLEVSFDYGFFDQAHFIRSFKSILGVPPSKLCMDKFFIPNSNEQFRFYTI